MWAKVNSYNIWWILVPYSDSFRICFSLHKISRTLNKNSCSVCVCIKVFCFFQSQVLIYWRRQISQIWLTYSAIGSSHMPKRLIWSKVHVLHQPVSTGNEMKSRRFHECHAYDKQPIWNLNWCPQKKRLLLHGSWLWPTLSTLHVIPWL